MTSTSPRDSRSLALHLEREAVVSLEPDGYREIHAPPAATGGYELNLAALRRRHPGLATELLWALQHQDRIGFPINIVTTPAPNHTDAEPKGAEP